MRGKSKKIATKGFNVRGKPVQVDVHKLSAGKYVEYENKEYEELDKFHTDRVGAKGHITNSETKGLEELEKLAMEEIIAEYLNYTTMASEEHLIKCRDAVEEIIAKYVNYSTMASVEKPAHSSPAKHPPAKFKPPAHAQALPTLGLQREEDTHGHAAGEVTRKSAPPTNPDQKTSKS
jgi:hypothetical protein